MSFQICLGRDAEKHGVRTGLRRAFSDADEIKRFIGEMRSADARIRWVAALATFQRKA
jgi:hypothetical protein